MQVWAIRGRRLSRVTLDNGGGGGADWPDGYICTDAVDVFHAAVFLTDDEDRSVTDVVLPVDQGSDNYLTSPLENAVRGCSGRWLYPFAVSIGIDR